MSAGHGRVVAVDLGSRRVGLAISDRTGTLARPLETIAVRGGDDAIDRVTRRIAELAAEDDGVGAVVVGLPRRLDGSSSPATRAALAFVGQLRGRVDVPVTTEDERLTSREAEQRLAAREPDWRRRKARLDAASAAVFLQDYLDRRS
ncbi:MAG: Holliday junction resolvase RuvX [Acidobacteria bacterium]|nr:Holliday junction resolvase RuvX [Acidobacteriota bacterium]